MDVGNLLKEAEKVRVRALAPISNFYVGSAILTKSGKIFSGCNIENFSLSLSICAERVALLKALSEGERDFEAISVVASGDDFCFPCGACRQLLWEFSAGIVVVLKNGFNEVKTVNIEELLPLPFGKHLLELERPRT